MCAPRTRRRGPRGWQSSACLAGTRGRHGPCPAHGHSKPGVPHHASPAAVPIRMHSPCRARRAPKFNPCESAVRCASNPLAPNVYRFTFDIIFRGRGSCVLPNSFRVLCASFFERARRASSHARGQHPRGTRGRQPPATARARGPAAEGERPVAGCGAHERDDGGRGAVAHDRRRCAAARGGARPAEGRGKSAEQGRSRLPEVPCCGFRGGRERLPSLDRKSVV